MVLLYFSYMAALKLGLKENLTSLCYCDQILVACPWCSFWDYDEVVD